jgi:hypothetical protein
MTTADRAGRSKPRGIAAPCSSDRPPLVLEHSPLLVKLPALGVEPLLQGLL